MSGGTHLLKYLWGTQKFIIPNYNRSEQMNEIQLVAINQAASYVNETRKFIAASFTKRTNPKAPFQATHSYAFFGIIVLNKINLIMLFK